MNRTIISLSIASAFVLSGAAPVSYADEECDGVLVQSRFALANCMIESAAAILAAKVTQGGCPAEGGEWDIRAVVPEYIFGTIPIQGWLEVTDNNGDYIKLSGESSARLQNSVNCRVTTTSDDNKLGGMKVTYSTGSENFYLDAIVDKDESLLCIERALSAGNIKFDPADDETDENAFECEESNSITFREEGDVIKASGLMGITCGGEDQGPGKGQGGPGGEGPASDWTLEEEVVIPPQDQTLEEAFELEIETGELGGCDIEVEAAIENLVYTTGDTTGGLTISGTLEVYVPEEDPEED